MLKINCHVSSSGRCDVQNTYNNATASIQAKLDVSLEYLKSRSRSEWCRPRAAKLSKCTEFRDFFEIRIFADRVQHRPIGFFGPKPNEFTILLWVIEKGNKFIPDNWCKIANRYRLEIIKNPSSVKELNS
jgi:hypothetical protein